MGWDREREEAIDALLFALQGPAPIADDLLTDPLVLVTRDCEFLTAQIKRALRAMGVEDFDDA